MTAQAQVLTLLARQLQLCIYRLTQEIDMSQQSKAKEVHSEHVLKRYVMTDSHASLKCTKCTASKTRRWW